MGYMGYMGYYRFQGTLGDLRDCVEHLDDENISDDEKLARKTLIKVCSEIHLDYGEDDD